MATDRAILAAALLFGCGGDKLDSPVSDTASCLGGGGTGWPDTATEPPPGETGETGVTDETGQPATEASFALLDPTDGDNWAAGSAHVVTWTHAAPAADGDRWPVAVLEWSADGGATWEPASSADGASGAAVLSPYDEESTFALLVPSDLGDALVLRVRDYDDEADADQAALTVGPSEEAAYTWTAVTLSAGFAARDGAGALVFDGKMWLLGGWNPSDRVNFPNITNSEVWSSTDGETWTEEVAEAPWEGRHTAGYAVFDEQMWVIGGDPIQGHYQPDVWSSPDGVTWTEVASDVPWGQRVLHHTAVLGDRVYVMGGQTLPHFTAEDDESAFYNDVWASEDGATWTQLLDEAPWSPRGMIGGSAVMGDRIWLLGGGTYDTPDYPDRNYYHEVWSTPDGVDWTLHVAHAPWDPRQYHDVAVWDDKLWVMEGYDGSGNRSDVWYSPDGESWYEVPDTPWAARHAASVFVHDDALWMVAGNNMSPDVWKLTRDED